MDTSNPSRRGYANIRADGRHSREDWTFVHHKAGSRISDRISVRYPPWRVGRIKVNLTARRITAKAGLLAALAVAVAALATPVQPPRIYSIGAGGAAAEADLMPSDPPVIRD
jgi:hypothetical protein